MESSTYFSLLQKTLSSLVICTLLVLICYHWVDQPVAFFVYQHHIHKFTWLGSLTSIADGIFILAPIYIVFYCVALAFKKLSACYKIFWVMALNVLITSYFKNDLKFLFGRYWPLTWKNNNPSLIQNHAYGFHPFHSGALYESFPSGHTAVTFAAMMVLWYAYPRWRWCYAIVCGLVITGLAGMDYHFISDIIAGAFLGAITAQYAVHLSDIKR